MPNYNNGIASSLPTRAQSPINMPRGAHPGAVLLSPNRGPLSSMSTGPGSGASGTTQSSQHSFSLRDMLDQQQAESSGGVGLISPLVQAQGASICGKTTFLESFGSRPSSAVGMHPPQPAQGQPALKMNNNIMVNFTNDVNQLCTWMAMLTPAQQNTVMDNLLSSLTEDVLQHTKLKLDSMTNSGYLSPSLRPIASPVPSRVAEGSSGLSAPNGIQLPGAQTLDSVLTDTPTGMLSNSAGAGSGGNVNAAGGGSSSSSSGVANMYRRWSPNPQISSVTQPMYDYLSEITRPRSADVGRLRSGYQPQSHHQNGQYQNGHHHNSSLSHVHHDSGNGSLFNSDSSVNNQNGSVYNGVKHTSPQSPTSSLAMSDSVSSIFSEPQGSTQQSALGSLALGSAASATASASAANASASNSASISTSSNSSNMNPKSLCDPKMLKNIPAWLKSLRLHKYSGSLDGMTWQELIELDDVVLEEIGVSALGARRKLLKAFAIVKDCKERGLINESAFSVKVRSKSDS
ncbi:HDL192Wp [Eremothecium sinecaudum]|uniref:RNA-binding protein VTS1 n=1 Tax=Eremothecium sinecaudum TaxID=45286 RepID=A0A120K265_9SACH|nr:HDL192Wp [Eremothecium sinecaudum]AMD20552.1 HDL192Wp [Eremothecium sinecaudum]